MNDIDVLIVVDVLGAVTSGDLGSNVYLIDTNKHFGSGNEGQEELQTACKDGQILRWRLASISASDDAEITGFTGVMVDQRVCTPVQQGMSGDTFYEGRVESRGTAATYQYSVELSFDGKAMTFDPALVVSTS